MANGVDVHKSGTAIEGYKEEVPLEFNVVVGESASIAIVTSNGTAMKCGWAFVMAAALTL